jgi:hypothetical protein
MLQTWALAQKATEEQAVDYWMSLSYEQKIKLVMDHINIINAVPEIEEPEYFYVLTEDKLTIFTDPEYLFINIHTLKYKMDFPVIEFEYKDKYKFPFIEAGITAGIFFIFGLLVR